MAPEPEPSSPDQAERGDPAAAAAGERSALIESLFREHNQSLIRFLAARLASEQEAREVAQEAYVRLLQLDQPGAIGFLRAFLFKTAANLATDRLRHRQIVRGAAQLEWFDLPSGSAPDSEVSAEQEVALIEAALAELPARCREAFLLSRMGGLGTREIAARMKVTERMVRAYLARALVHCRERIDGANAGTSGRAKEGAS
jgi:RNA polymerase sigma-70 factor (ECF subfamily)